MKHRATGTVRRVVSQHVRRLGKRVLRSVGEFQGRHSLVGDTPVLANDKFAWSARLTGEFASVRAELDQLLGDPSVQVPSFHHISPDQARISTGDNWKTFVFYVFGQRIHHNCLRCPRTATLLDGMPHLQNAWFSILAPHCHIPAHRGPTRAVVRAHLGLRVPQAREHCWMRVDQQICHWREGELLVFDDTFEHEVRNDTEEVRVVLFMDFERPMDPAGRLLNAVLLQLLRMSAYVRVPLANLEALARRQRSRHRNRGDQGGQGGPTAAGGGGIAHG